MVVKAGLATVVASAVFGFAAAESQNVIHKMWEFWSSVFHPGVPYGYIGALSVIVVGITITPFVLCGILIYAALGLVIRPRHDTTAETRCRKCGYILKGLRRLGCPPCSLAGLDSLSFGEYGNQLFGVAPNRTSLLRELWGNTSFNRKRSCRKS